MTRNGPLALGPVKASLVVVALSALLCACDRSDQDQNSASATAAPSAVAAATARSSATTRPRPRGLPNDAVQAYYDAINAKKLVVAYAQLSPAAQKRHSFADFVKYQSSIDQTVVKILGGQGDVVSVNVSEHHTDDAANLQILSGTWRAVPSADGSRWLLDRGEFSPPKEVAIAPAVAVSPLPDASSGTAAGGSEARSGGAGSEQSSTSSVPPPAYNAPATFHGFACEEYSCVGHRRGYEWAEEKGIDNPHTCYSGPRLSNPNMSSFSEGCEAYVDDSTGASPLDPSDRYDDSDEGH